MYVHGDLVLAVTSLDGGSHAQTVLNTMRGEQLRLSGILKRTMSSAKSNNPSETARAINEFLHLAEEDQAPPSEVIAKWLDFEEREGDSDGESDYSDDMDDTGIQHKPVRGEYLTIQ